MLERFLCRRDMEHAELAPFAGGEVGVFSTRCPGKTSANEDAGAILEVDSARGLLVVADGMGGGPAGEAAAEAAVRALADALASVQDGDSLRECVLDGVESANRSVSEAAAGAATTLAIAEIDGRSVRTYHVGDSGALIVGQRGRVKHVTVAHSPTGYAVEAGVMDEEEALEHRDRHLVSNVVGTPEMKIEIGPPIRLAPRDTLLLATDGVFDNLRLEEIGEAIRTGRLPVATERLAEAVRLRMAAEVDSDPAKPDDCTFLIYRAAR